MATRDVQDPTTPGDWWSQQPPPPTTTPTTTATAAPGTPGGPLATNPDGTQVGAGLPWDPVTGAPIGTVPGYHWDPKYAAWMVGDAPKATSTGTTETGTGPVDPNFGALPPPYASDPNAPTYTPLAPYVAPTWTGGDYVPPTVQDLENSPGYQARLDAGLQGRNRAAAASGTVLNGGTLKALDRYSQDYATNEYQTLSANTLDAYKERYAQFTDAAGRDLASRTVNANDNLTTYANRTSAYTAGNARTLSDYLTNVTTRRNHDLDYWGRLQDLNQTGAGAAGNSR